MSRVFREWLVCNLSNGDLHGRALCACLMALLTEIKPGNNHTLPATKCSPRLESQQFVLLSHSVSHMIPVWLHTAYTSLPTACPLITHHWLFLSDSFMQSRDYFIKLVCNNKNFEIIKIQPCPATECSPSDESQQFVLLSHNVSQMIPVWLQTAYTRSIMKPTMYPVWSLCKNEETFYCRPEPALGRPRIPLRPCCVSVLCRAELHI